MFEQIKEERLSWDIMFSHYGRNMRLMIFYFACDGIKMRSAYVRYRQTQEKDMITSKKRIVEQKTGKIRILYLRNLQDLIRGFTAARRLPNATSGLMKTRLVKRS